MNKISNIICQIAELSSHVIKYIIDGDGRIRTHFIPHESDFDYQKLELGKFYVITSENIDGMWYWEKAIILDMSKAIEKR